MRTRWLFSINLTSKAGRRWEKVTDRMRETCCWLASSLVRLASSLVLLANDPSLPGEISPFLGENAPCSLKNLNRVLLRELVGLLTVVQGAV